MEDNKNSHTNSVGGRKVKLGDRFGRLVVIGPAKDVHNKIHYRCLCDCGVEKDVPGYSLLSGDAKSCGCYKNEVLRDRVVTHGLSRTRTYQIWCAMKQRCYDTKSESYGRYGGRGISICERWRESFENFLADMGTCPSKKHSIDRTDTDGNYEPGNCRWATAKVQGNNTRRNVRFEYMGEMKTISEISDIVGIPYRTIYYRIFSYGWTPEKAYSTPVDTTHHRKTNPWKIG